MADKTDKIDADLADGIAVLEQILEVMPQDAATLKALYSAYSQSGQRERAFEYLGKLSRAIHDTNEIGMAVFAMEHLQLFADDFPDEVATQLALVQALEVHGASPSPASPSSSKGDADISEELALAWKLYEENQFSQEEYSSILHDLTEVSSKELDVPASVLHVLNDRGFNQMNRIMNYMSSRSGVPCISLSSFELTEKEGGALPLDMAAHDGALPFGFFGNDLLVGVLNPFNNALVDKVETTSGHRCHTYLVSPEEYDLALGRLRGLAKAEGAAA